MSDTIVAIASATGRSAIAVVRLSGKDTFRVLQKVILPADIDKLQHRKAVVLDLFKSAESVSREFVDKCVVVTFVAPHSYTGEDLVELYCHGGYVVPQLLVDTLVAAGARVALPGEFTQRAFFNEKMDLLQAESVEAIVAASSRSELRFAHQHYSGQFSSEIRRLRAELIDLLSLLELELDFSEEDVEFADRDEIFNRLAALQELLAKLLQSYQRTHLLRDGIKVAIVGRPNVGKSSLLNLLLKKERAIVTELPGTTRDIIEESLEIAGLKFVFIDTAGIRTTEDYVEKLGIDRSQSVLENATITLLLVDHNSVLKKEDWQIRQLVLDRKTNNSVQPIVLFNKSDLPRQASENELESFAKGFYGLDFSSKTGAGLDALEQQLVDVAKMSMGQIDMGDPVLLNIRQKNLVSKALAALNRSIESFSQNLSQEFISAELRFVLDFLGELIGEVTTEDILGNIFSNFCIGK